MLEERQQLVSLLAFMLRIFVGFFLKNLIFIIINLDSYGVDAGPAFIESVSKVSLNALKAVVNEVHVFLLNLLFS
jgi:hypothetical protein